MANLKTDFDLPTPSDIKQNIAVLDWSTDNSATICHYTLNGKDLAFIATPEYMASELKVQGFIDRYSVEDNAVFVTHSTDGDRALMAALEDYMSAFSQSDWISLLVTYEYCKASQAVTKQIVNSYKTATA